MTHSIEMLDDLDGECLKGTFELRDGAELDAFLERLGHAAGAVFPKWAQDGEGDEAGAAAADDALGKPEIVMSAAAVVVEDIDAYKNRLTDDERAKIGNRQAIIIGMKRAGFKHRQVADKLGIAENTVANQVAYAKSKGVTV
jgi:hypothetical protein